VSSVVYGVLRILTQTVAWLCFRFRIVGQVPKTGAFIVAANHASYLDIPLLGCGMRRRAWYLGRSDLFPARVVNRLLQWLGWIPLRLGRLDRDAFGKAISLLKEGKVVVIFPEGSRTEDGRLQSAKPGLGMIVAQTGCSVIPAYLKGTHEVLPVQAKWPKFRPVTVTYGEPITFAPMRENGEGNKKYYQEVSQRVMERIAALGGVEPPTRHDTAGTRNAE
jgi:1-acyl-sn-glycerol-3-phosphate acyltransferase